MMNLRNFQPGMFVKDSLTVLQSAFVAFWPGILTNWLSELMGNYLQINTTPGAWIVIGVTIASLLQYGLMRRRMASDSPHNTPAKSRSNATHFLMQGGMFSLALALTQVCQGVYSGPLTDDKILPAVLALIPALEGSLGSQFIYIANNKPIHFVDAAIRELVLNNTRVSERMILEQARTLGKKQNMDPFSSMTNEAAAELIRSRMMHLIGTGQLNMYLGRQQNLSINYSSKTNTLRIEKKAASYGEASPDAMKDLNPAIFEQQRMKEIEKHQQDAWHQLRKDFDDEKAFYQLCEQTYHTKHGLLPSVKIEIVEMINQILLQGYQEHRPLTRDEQDKLSVLRKVLGNT